MFTLLPIFLNHPFLKDSFATEEFWVLYGMSTTIMLC